MRRTRKQVSDWRSCPCVCVVDHCTWLRVPHSKRNLVLLAFYFNDKWKANRESLSLLQKKWHPLKMISVKRTEVRGDPPNTLPERQTLFQDDYQAPISALWIGKRKKKRFNLSRCEQEIFHLLDIRKCFIDSEKLKR